MSIKFIFGVILLILICPIIYVGHFCLLNLRDNFALALLTIYTFSVWLELALQVFYVHESR